MNERIEKVNVYSEPRTTHGCILTKVWREYGEEELGAHIAGVRTVGSKIFVT